MKKLLAIFLTLLLMVTVCLPVTAAGLNIPTIEIEGKTYYNLSGKNDYFKAARYGIDNGLTAVPVYIEYSKFSDYISNNIWYCNVNNFDYTQEGLYFSYREYATSTVCMTAYHHDFENNREYGDIEISYIDSAEELKQGDKMLDAELAKVASYSKKDKIRYIAEYICKKVDAGVKQMPGGYDIINGVYDLMTGVRTNVVCSSFAFLFQRFMERAGYKSYIATGGNHAWNVVELDGKWYGVDCTYGDNGTALNDDYFLMGMDHLKGYITTTENVFAELEKEQGCQFAQVTYGAKATTTSATKKPITPMAPTTTTGRPVNTTTAGDVASDPTSADEIITTTTSQEGEETTTTTTAAPVVTVDISDTAEVASQVFESAAQNGETLVLKAQEYQWSFAASKLTNVSDSVPINTAINLGSAVAQEDIAVLEELNKEEAFFPFSFEHHGALPGEAEISIRVDESFAEKAVDIYSINADGAAVLEGTGTVSADGELIFTTNHCSLWFIKEAQPVSDGPSGMIWLIVAVAAVLVVGGGVAAWLLIRKKR